MADPGGRGAVARSDLLITVLLIALLSVVVCLIQPSTNTGGGVRLQCESDMRTVSTAFHYYATQRNGELPLLRGTLLEDDADRNNAPYETGWAFSLLPYLDQEVLHDKLPGSNAATNREHNHPNSFVALSNANIPALTCLDSPRAGQPGALGYVVNTGYMTADIWDDPKLGLRYQVSGTYNWNNGPANEHSPDDEAVSRATGVILYDARGRGQHFNDITDGTSNTLLLAENLNAGRWISGAPHEVGFAVRIGGTAARVLTAAESPQGLGGGTQETALQFHTAGGRPAIDLGPSAINANLDSNSRSLPRPSSVHPGCVNVIFCDGHGRTISDKIDPSFYARLVSSAGMKFGQAIVHDNDF